MHKYDSIGICIYCDRCNDTNCCEQIECDKRAIEAITRALAKIHKPK